MVVRPPHNLSLALTGLVGREQELTEVRQLLNRTRLLTLTGAGGVGKSRLGLEVASLLVGTAAQPGPSDLDTIDAVERSGCEPDLADGVWLVELAALTDPLQVPQAVAAVLGVQDVSGQSATASTIDVLRQRQLLLVLDNCEHLVDACAAFVDAVLRACPSVRMLVTSRQPLEVAGETTFRVPPLTVATRELSDPSVDRPDLWGSGRQSDAAHLFAARARAVTPGFQPDARQWSTIETVCRRLDGIPLAIELAAARLGLLSVEQLAARLDDRFRLLSGGNRGALLRYRTLRATIDWSYDLLDSREQVLLRRLAAFAGGWSLEAAEAVCSDDEIEGADVLDLVSQLVARSMVTVTQVDSAIRYGFLESVRAYALERLRDSGEEGAVRQRHCDWALGLADRAEPNLRGPRSDSWMASLECERANLRAALIWCIERDDGETGLRMAGALWRFWLVRGPYREVRELLSALLALPSACGRSRPIQMARAKVLCAAGRIAMRQDDRVAAEAQFQEALEIARELRDLRGVAISLTGIGHLARVRGEYGRACQVHEEAAELFAALGERGWLAQSLDDLGVAAYFQGEFVRAREYYESSLAIYEGLGDELGMVSSLNDLGEVALQRGELEAARTLLCASLTMARRLDDKERIAMTLAALAGLATVGQQPVRAVRLGAAAFRLNERTGQRNSPAWYATVERWLGPARAALSAEACLAAEVAGRTMTLDAAIDDALKDEAAAIEPRELNVSDRDFARFGSELARTSRELPTPNVDRDTRPVVPVRSVGIVTQDGRIERALTRREREVAALVARGMTNRQIADALVITEGTAANHVKNILARLVLDSRVQIAVWATERGLLQLQSA